VPNDQQRSRYITVRCELRLVVRGWQTYWISCNSFEATYKTSSQAIDKNETCIACDRGSPLYGKPSDWEMRGRPLKQFTAQSFGSNVSEMQFLFSDTMRTLSLSNTLTLLLFFGNFLKLLPEPEDVILLIIDWFWSVAKRIEFLTLFRDCSMCIRAVTRKCQVCGRNHFAGLRSCQTQCSNEHRTDFMDQFMDVKLALHDSSRSVYFWLTLIIMPIAPSNGSLVCSFLVVRCNKLSLGTIKLMDLAFYK
jgi:hypothetical protein